jgi:hypothetical protein
MKENFDDILKRRWEERQFPVDDIHREEMAKLLERDKKRRGIIFWWVGSMAVIMIAGYFIWMNANPKGEVKAEVKSEVKNEVKSDADVKSEVRTDEPLTETSRDKSVGSNSASSSMVNTKGNASTADVKSSHVEKQNTVKGKNTHSSPAKGTKTKAKDPITVNESKSSSKHKHDEVVKTNTTQQKAEEIGDSKEAPAEGYKVELENPNQATILSKEAAIRVFPDSLEYDPWTNAIYRDGTVRSLNITRPVDDLEISEVESLSKHVPGNITPHTKVTHPLYFIAETGIGLVLASKPYYDGGIKFNVGGGLGIKLMPKIHLQLTGGYQMQDGGFDFQKTSTINTLGFGVRSQFNTLQPDRLHFVYGKLGAAYRFNRSTINSHFGVQWLYGSQGNITRQEQNQVPPSQDQTTKYAWLNTDGLRKTQWWWDVSYGYMLFPKFYLHGGASYYFTSLTETDVPENNYTWKGKTAKVQPFVTINYLLHANL